MNSTDFAKFYDNQPEYAAFRSDIHKREYYDVASDWKVRELVKLVPGNMVFNNVLEVGCAFGVLLNNISDRLNIKTRTGVDISGENIKTAKKDWPECTFFNGTVEEFILEIKPNIQNFRFDLVVLSDIVEHIPDDIGFMKTIRGISSYVLLNLPLEKSFRTRNRVYGETDLSGHLRSYNKEIAVNLITSAGYSVLKSFTSIAFFDRQFYEIYKRNRSKRINIKPIHLKIFWTLFYLFQDRLKLTSKGLTERMYGTNYFALLKSNDI
jgi:SAM-dependent methyltransferase